ncbi:MAG: GNAT family N-acetyltransferase, partial [Candidatus Thorarchaeota archaeon]
MYEGKLARLRRLTTDDTSTIMTLWNSYELRQYLPTPLPTSHDDMVKYIDSANESFTNRKGFTFGIEDLKTNELIGLVNLVNISW